MTFLAVCPFEETICIKCQMLFSRTKKENILMSSEFFTKHT